MQREQRRLAAILAADVAGYSRLMEADESGTLARLKVLQTELIEPTVSEFQGRIVGVAGDGYIVEFASSVNAVRCAVETQARLVARNADMPDDRRMAFRMGINIGDVIVDGDDIHGDGVNVAARLEKLAEPGGIAISGEVYRTVHKKLDLRWEDRGERHLKNLADPVHIYQLLVDGQRWEAPSASADPIPIVHGTEAGSPSIAVLSFEDMGTQAKFRPLQRALARDVATALAKFRELVVISSHSVASIGAHSLTLHDIGRLLRARYLVLGSVQGRSGRLRLNVQLVEAATGRELCAERYDRDVGELFMVQDEIVRIIVATLVSTVDLSERQRISVAPTDSLEAYGFYVRGRDLWSERAAAENADARRMFEKAIALDSRFARAYGSLSFTLIEDWRNGWNGGSDAALERAHELALQAVALGPRDYDNQWSLAITQIYQREFELGMASYERALALNPGDADLLAEMAEAMVLVGQPERAVEQIEHAIRLNPYHPEWYRWDLGWALYQSGRYDQALRVLRGTVKPSVVVLKDLAATLVRLDRLDEARAVVRRILDREPTATLAPDRAWPFKEQSRLDAFVNDLRRAGLPD